MCCSPRLGFPHFIFTFLVEQPQLCLFFPSSSKLAPSSFPLSLPVFPYLWNIWPVSPACQRSHPTVGLCHKGRCFRSAWVGRFNPPTEGMMGGREGE